MVQSRNVQPGADRSTRDRLARHVERPRARNLGLLACQGYLGTRTGGEGQRGVPRRILQLLEPRKLWPMPDELRQDLQGLHEPEQLGQLRHRSLFRRFFRGCRANREYLNHLAANSIWFEVNLLTRVQQLRRS